MIIATPALTVSDAVHFWQEAIKVSLLNCPALKCLQLDEDKAITGLHFGLAWLNSTNWSGIAVGHDGRVMDKVQSNWTLAEYLLVGCNF